MSAIQWQEKMLGTVNALEQSQNLKIEISRKELYNAESYNVDLYRFMFELFLTVHNVCISESSQLTT